MELTFILEDLDCANCAEKIRIAVEGLEGIEYATMNFMSKKLKVKTNQNDLSVQKSIEKIVKKIEPDINVYLENKNNKKAAQNESLKFDLIKIIISLSLFIITIAFLGKYTYLQTALYLISYLLAAYESLWAAVRNISKGRIFDENFLMAIATIGAIIIGKYPEAVEVMLFYQVGELFQSYAVNRSRKSISDLMDIRPDYANIKNGNNVKKISPYEISVGDTIVVYPGEKIPLDGTVLNGASMIDTKALTGESVPRSASAGTEVLSGCINQSGTLEISVSKPFGESTVAKILELVENSGSKKAEAENFITRFARWYTPLVVIVAVLLAAVPPLFFGQVFSEWLYRALVFLVISCPCALVISIPLSFFGGIGGASKCGVLVKGGNYLELLSKCRTIVFDKTGTLTEGSFEVSEIHPAGITELEFLKLCAIAESHSNHPIAMFVKRAYGKEIPYNQYPSEEISGKGTKTDTGEKILLAGNKKLMEMHGISVPKTSAGTVVHLAADNQYLGYLIISDKIKPDSQKAISMLSDNGISKIVMLTGDSKAAAESTAKALKIKEVYAELLPADKVEKVESLLGAQASEEKLAFVGDGINDAPVLARADIGIAMGALGSDAAIEAADIVLMTDEPSRIASAIKISRKTIRIVKQNIIFALVVKFTVLILGAAGYATMGAAVFADVGVSIIAILNAVRCLNVKKYLN